MNGRLVQNSTFNVVTGESTNEFNFKLDKGIYLLKVSSPNGDYSQKLIIK